jgi:hypothetical protein
MLENEHVQKKMARRKGRKDIVVGIINGKVSPKVPT